MPKAIDIIAAAGEDYSKAIEALAVDTRTDREQEEYIKEYKGYRTRRDTSVGKREDKVITTTSTKKVFFGQDKEITETKIIKVARLVFDFPKKIVRTTTSFCVGGEMIISSGGEADDAFEAFKDKWEKTLKMKGLIKKFVRTVMIETKAALLYYPITEGNEDGKENDIRVTLLTSKNGEFYPHFDKYGDMDAFIRRYQTKNDDNKEITVAEVYMDDVILTFTKENNAWSRDSKPNLFKKIPVVYAEQDEPEWDNVAGLMDKFEMRISRLADTNDYFSEPMLKLFGEAKTLPGKENVGKMVEFKMEKNLGGDGKPTHGDAQYLTWDQTPESMKLELDMLWNGIYTMSSTPDLSFDNVKGIGSNLSGIALKLMFLDAILNATDKMEIFGPAIQRMVSVVVAGIVNVSDAKHKSLEEADIEVNFKSPLPDDLKELLEMLGQAKSDGIASTETVVDNNPLVKDKKEEVKRIKASEQSNAAKQGDFIIGSQD